MIRLLCKPGLVQCVLWPRGKATVLGRLMICSQRLTRMTDASDKVEQAGTLDLIRAAMTRFRVNPGIVREACGALSALLGSQGTILDYLCGLLDYLCGLAVSSTFICNRTACCTTCCRIRRACVAIHDGQSKRGGGANACLRVDGRVMLQSKYVAVMFSFSPYKVSRFAVCSGTRHVCRQRCVTGTRSCF